MLIQHFQQKRNGLLQWLNEIHKKFPFCSSQTNTKLQDASNRVKDIAKFYEKHIKIRTFGSKTQ